MRSQHAVPRDPPNTSAAHRKPAGSTRSARAGKWSARHPPAVKTRSNTIVCIGILQHPKPDGSTVTFHPRAKPLGIHRIDPAPRRLDESGGGQAASRPRGPEPPAPGSRDSRTSPPTVQNRAPGHSLAQGLAHRPTVRTTSLPRLNTPRPSSGPPTHECKHSLFSGSELRLPRQPSPYSSRFRTAGAWVTVAGTSNAVARRHT